MLRTHKVGRIAAFIPYPQITDVKTVVVSRGRREGVRKGLLYFVLCNDSEGEEVALLKVFDVKEKMAQARPLWVSERCPTLKRGWHVFLYRSVIKQQAPI